LVSKVMTTLAAISFPWRLMITPILVL
jgi:hypothetical protein